VLNGLIVKMCYLGSLNIKTGVVFTIPVLFVFLHVNAIHIRCFKSKFIYFY